MAKEFAPNFNTPEENLSKEELNKIASNGMRGPLSEELDDSEKGDIAWEAEQIAKSYGVYLEFDRAKSGREKDWRYMVRLGIPGGGPLNAEHWRVLDDIAEKYTEGPRDVASLRLTTRQNIQYHWIKKEDVKNLIATCAESGLLSINGCGDNVRNVMGCPLSRYSTVFDGVEWSQKTADYFRLPVEPFIQIFEVDSSFLREETEVKRFDYGKKLLNRKFKIGFSSVHKNPTTGKLTKDNCVELLTNDMGIAPVIDNNSLVGFQVYVGGGQGERHGKPSVATLAQPLCFVKEEQLLEVMDAVVAVHRDWGDRENRHWARLKYVIKAQGIEWYREKLQEYLGYKVDLPIPDYDIGPRELHHGWNLQESNQLWAYGMYIENGRIDNGGPNGDQRTLVQHLLDTFPTEVIITPNQDIMFANIPENLKSDFEKELDSFDYGKRNGKAFSKLRMLSGACVGRDTCRLTYTDSEKFEPELLDQLEEMGWGEQHTSIGITGCERQCFRPSTKSIGLIGTGLNRYQLRVFGTEDARNQGRPLYSEDRSLTYLRSIPREEVANVIDTLLSWHKEQGQSDEELGYFLRRVGEEQVISYLQAHEKTKELMENTTKVKAYLE